MNRFQYVLVCCAVIFTTCSGQGIKNVEITKVDFETETKLLKLDVKMKKQDDGVTVVDVDGYLLEDLNNNIFITNTISKKLTNGDYHVLIKTNRMNMCDFFKKPEKEPFLKVFFGNLKKYGYMMYECPVKKDHYYLNNFQLLGENLPSFTPTGEYKVDFAILRKVNNNNFAQVYRMVWYAKVTNA